LSGRPIHSSRPHLSQRFSFSPAATSLAFRCLRLVGRPRTSSSSNGINRDRPVLTALLQAPFVKPKRRQHSDAERPLSCAICTAVQSYRRLKRASGRTPRPRQWCAMVAFDRPSSLAIAACEKPLLSISLTASRVTDGGGVDGGRGTKSPLLTARSHAPREIPNLRQHSAIVAPAS
jgi:hypothetical protein